MSYKPTGALAMPSEKHLMLVALNPLFQALKRLLKKIKPFKKPFNKAKKTCFPPPRPLKKKKKNNSPAQLLQSQREAPQSRKSSLGRGVMISLTVCSRWCFKYLPQIVFGSRDQRSRSRWMGSERRGKCTVGRFCLEKKGKAGVPWGSYKEKMQDHGFTVSLPWGGFTAALPGIIW